ncbi:MAG: hypothetical protein ABGX07_14940 [Pirellulaceae bacterium]|nr:hypothetical protein [Planctomycetaceae bacterium]HIM28432.1 hypothetical protein [Planctomycetota bacterium]
MLDDKSQLEVKPIARTTAIIVFSLCSGVVVFGVFVVFMIEPKPKPEAYLLTYMSLGFAVIETVICLVVPGVMVKMARKQIAAGSWKYQERYMPSIETDAGKLAVLYQQTTIVGCALLEGGAFFALTANMIESHVSTLVVAVLLLIGMAMYMPYGNRVSWWVESQLHTVEYEKGYSAVK